MIYDIKKGYGLQLTKFDEQYQDTIIYRQSKREVIELADKILLTFLYLSQRLKHFSISLLCPFSCVNTIQLLDTASSCIIIMFHQFIFDILCQSFDR